MLRNLLFLFLFFLPAIIANMMPVFVAKMPTLRRWNYPLDFFVTWRDQRLLGDHKTFRGLIFGILAGILTNVVIFLILPHVSFAQQFPATYLQASALGLGFLLGFGALLGDAVKSFFKRQFSIPAGKTWFPFDQLDSVIGAALCSALLVRLSVVEYIVVLVGGLGLHLLIVYIGYLTHLREQAI